MNVNTESERMADLSVSQTLSLLRIVSLAYPELSVEKLEDHENGDQFLTLIGSLQLMTPGVVQGTVKAARVRGSIPVVPDHFGRDTGVHDAVVYAGVYVRRLRDHLLAELLAQDGFRNLLDSSGRDSSLIV